MVTADHYNNRPARLLYRLMQEASKSGFRVGTEDPWNHLESWEHHTLSDIVDAVRCAPAGLTDQDIERSVHQYNGGT